MPKKQDQSLVGQAGNLELENKKRLKDLSKGMGLKKSNLSLRVIHNPPLLILMSPSQDLIQ